jgi:ADP-sugar diphosphatase
MSAPLIKAEGVVDMIKAQSSKVFQDFLQGLDPRFLIKEVTFQSVDYFGERAAFVKFQAEATFQAKPVPGIALCRGPAVSILMVLNCVEKSEKFVVMVRQARFAIGRWILELPAGMMDDSKKFKGKIIDEVREETLIDLNAETIKDMTDLAYGPGTLAGPGGAEALVAGGPLLGMYSSMGLLDEYIRLMVHESDITVEELDKIHGRIAGKAEEGELIRVEVVPLTKAWQVSSDPKLLGSLTLYRELKLQGKL